MKMILRKLSALAMGLVLLGTGLTAQDQLNTAQRLMQDERKLTIGGYGQIDYNQPLSGGEFSPGNLDVHRLVLMFGYKFTEKTQFVTELEFEHVKEVYVEQAFLQHEITPWLKFRGGLMLVPMGIINEYHEPPTFNGVERPNVDKYIVPTTWREIGAGFTGVFPAQGFSYQLYVMNGFKGYDSEALLNGSNGFRKGRQKGAESLIHAPSLAAKVDYFGLSGLQLGISLYSGKSQSTLYDGLDKNDVPGVAAADSSVVGLSMIGADARYTIGGLAFRGQFNLGSVSDGLAYNEYTGSDLGKTLLGWYTEVSYNLFHSLEGAQTQLIPFVRYEQYHTHAAVEEGMDLNDAYNRSDLTFGLGWKITAGAMLKVDYQIFNNKAANESKQQFNAGVGIWF